MLVAGSSWLYGDPMLIAKMSDGSPVIFRGTSIASDMLDSVSMHFVESDHFFSGTYKTSAGLITDKDSMSEPAEEVFEHGEADISSDGWRVDCALVINAEGLAR